MFLISGSSGTIPLLLKNKAGNDRKLRSNSGTLRKVTSISADDFDVSGDQSQNWLSASKELEEEQQQQKAEAPDTINSLLSMEFHFYLLFRVSISKTKGLMNHPCPPSIGSLFQKVLKKSQFKSGISFMIDFFRLDHGYAQFRSPSLLAWRVQGGHFWTALLSRSGQLEKA